MVQVKGETVQSCLDDLLQDDEVQLECTRCQNKKLSKKMQIISEPSTLILQLTRYKYDSKEDRILKKQERINYSETIKLPSGSSYSLSSIVNHIGSSPDEGHYNILINDAQTGSFLMLDDSNAFNVDITSEMNSLSYIVFYTKS